MDTVSMLNKMSFYCQPILPLVYDESMSYYETLCKVVGQLNTTGDAVNKLNEGLTGEIAGRQEADRRLNERLTSEIAGRQEADRRLNERLTSEISGRQEADRRLNERLTSEIDGRHEAERLLNERLKAVEATNKKIHFLAFAGTPPHNARPVGDMPTRSELRQWINDRDMIVTVMETTDEERNVVYATSCTYNAVNWTQESPADFNIIVPISTDYDSERDYAVRQKIAKITIPPGSESSLDDDWGLQFIEINTPSTSADGVVNIVAVISNSDSVNCSITPSEFLGLYNTTRGGKNLCVAVNAKLAYDSLARSSAVATVDTTNRKIRIAFERDYGTFINNGVKQLNKTLDYIIGDASTNVWTHETIDSKTLDFSRYEGFQFTRGADNVITANDESTPNAVYAQYHSDTSGKIYQNLPVRLVDTVDNAEYWNGVFDIKENKHMTFTFVTSNYVTASDKMAVRVIELSADANTTTWKYAEKEFTLPLEASNDVVTYTASNVGEGVYSATKHKTEYQVDFNETTANIIAAIESGKKVILRVDLKELGSNETYPVYFASGYTRADLFANSAHYIFAGTFGGDQVTLELNSLLTHATLVTYGYILPEPNPDGSDNGKVPTINGTAWELKTPTGGGSTNAVLYTAQTLTDAQKKQARENIDAASYFVITATPDSSGSGVTLDKTESQIKEAISAGKTPVVRFLQGSISSYLPLLNATSSIFIFGGVLSGEYGGVLNMIYIGNGSVRITSQNLLATNADGDLNQQTMAYPPVEDMQIATKKYVDDHLSGAPITIKLGTGNAATSTATFAEIKAALEAGKAPILDSETGTNHWFALNWTLSGSGSLSIQYGSFEVTSGGAANFLITDVGVSSTGITYASRQFTTE